MEGNTSNIPVNFQYGVIKDMLTQMKSYGLRLQLPQSTYMMI